MNKHKHKVLCRPNNAQRNEATKLSRSPKDDVGLCLEVEMDEEVKDIITSPEKCASTLLDVTVIKPKEKTYTTQKRTMSGDEVRQFIAAMNVDPKQKQQHAEQSQYVDYSSGDGITNPCTKDKQRRERKCEVSENKKVYYLDDPEFFEQIKYLLQRETEAPSEVQQVYTTPKAFYDLNKVFTCKNKYRLENDKPLSPCLCKNCAIVGIVADSQKRPFATEDMMDPRELINPCRRREKEDPSCRRKRCVNFEDDHIACQLYFKQLSAKIRELEARLAIQEEKSVPKDYFRRIITKLVTHITKIAPNNVKPQSSTSRKYSPPEPCRDCRDKRDKYSPLYHKYVVQPMIIEEPVTHHYPVRTQAEKDPNVIPVIHTSAKQGRHTTHSISSTWKWRDEILKPGIDLKNRIISLMEETLNVLKWSKEKPKEDELKDFVDELSNNLYKAVNELPVKESKQNDENKCQPVSSAPAGTGGRLKKEAVSVAYVNPKMSKWHESQESKTSSILKNESHDSINYYKNEFIQTILNTKEEDRRKLWQSIWQQALANKQSKSDKISIQFPGKHEQGRGENVQIEYTIGELEHLLLGKKEGRRSSKTQR
ncbi:unnamed protein product [Callosobruchus maculatus]|uniref:Uncharacterized protein n=1 Tax=Callosobruchus maculatus TaxID=64391 RepID=A0A653CDT9_CALMS|nr:unnamed protein product [Callosobruchus maculatus]